MKTVFLVYTCDIWHTRSSYALIGIADSNPMARVLCKRHAKKEGYKLSNHDLNLLANINQTQDYEGPGEFIIEEQKLNQLL